MPTGRIALSSSGSPFTMAFWKQVGLSWEGLIYRGCGHCRVCWCSRSLISYNNDCSGVICVCVCVCMYLGINEMATTELESTLLTIAAWRRRPKNRHVLEYSVAVYPAVT